MVACVRRYHARVHVSPREKKSRGNYPFSILISNNHNFLKLKQSTAPISLGGLNCVKLHQKTDYTLAKMD
jgi:hypothetical protein